MKTVGFHPKFTITNRMTSAITRIERARGFLEAAQLSDDWVREMGQRALILEAHHTTHIEGTRLTLDQAERLWKGEAVPEADPDDTRELLNYRSAFAFVSETQMIEVRDRGEQVILRDVLVQKHHLSDRQAKAIGHILEQGNLTIQDFERLCPDVNRRSLQRDLRAMVDVGLLTSEGATNKLVYRLKAVD